ncbi:MULTISPECIES: DUF4867 family protein [Bacillaceae]|uniref:DUF4867 family protein n=1 Tax=Bacillaceae TaxID=186817 RepID=UPI0010466FFF|nr:DUF4867 family protein [Bacillus sp. CBEL-1]TDB50164.1 DUF4867 family protein [Bacillus sp. CBEL-1]
MSKFEQLKSLNSHLSFYHVEEKQFKNYGKVITDYNFDEIKAYMEEIQIPSEGNIYVASDSIMEEKSLKKQIEANSYGQMPIQIGYCNGLNTSLNGLEYHQGNEINFAVTDMVLLLGKVQDISEGLYDSKNVDAFFIPEGTAVELYGTTLHFAPCKVTDEGFKTIVILPKGTNEPLAGGVDSKSDQLLFMKNKWLLAHPDRKILIDKGAHPGIKGDNIQVNY